jgi:hypothetical protein
VAVKSPRSPMGDFPKCFKKHLKQPLGGECFEYFAVCGLKHPLKQLKQSI